MADGIKERPQHNVCKWKAKLHFSRGYLISWQVLENVSSWTLNHFQRCCTLWSSGYDTKMSKAKRECDFIFIVNHDMKAMLLVLSIVILWCSYADYKQSNLWINYQWQIIFYSKYVLIDVVRFYSLWPTYTYNIKGIITFCNGNGLVL